MLAKSPELSGCTGDPSCLAPIARALGVDQLVAGTVGGLGDSYVVNLKLVDAVGAQRQRVTATLHGSPDELIHEVRVAAYRLAAPERLVGSVSLLTDATGAGLAAHFTIH